MKAPKDPDLQPDSLLNRRKKILVIGATHAQPVCDMLPLLEGFGYEIINVGACKELSYDNRPLKTHLNLKDTPTSVKTFDMSEFGMGINHVDLIRERSLEAILNVLGRDDFDFILHFQDWTLTTETEKFRIPYFYVISEAWAPWVPESAWAVFCGTDGMQKIVTHFYPEMPTDLIPYSPMSSLLQKILPSTRPVRCSFAGSLYSFNELYTFRREVIEFLNQHSPACQIDVPAGHWEAGKKPYSQIGRGKLNHDEYKEMIASSQIGINVPTDFGTNYRDFEICALGAMLLTKETSDHRRLGFKDGVNCCFYNSPEEALKIIENISDVEIEQIAAEGKKLVNTKHNYFIRVSELLIKIGAILKDGK